MSKLPTDPSKFSDAHSRFIKGHLLNDWLGGVGVPRNLFPITAHANTLHSSKIEEAVKDWVNNKKFWVKYEVSISVGNYDLGPGIDDNFVNSTLTAEASVLNTKLKPVASLTRKVVVESTFLQPATVDVQKTEDEAKLAKQTARAEDVGVVPLGTSRQSEGPTIPTFPDMLENALKATINRIGKDVLNTRLASENGWGPAYIGVLWKAYEFIKRKSDKTLTNLDSDEARNFRAMVTRWKNETAPLIRN